MSKAKIMENRMRRTADRLGFSVSKSRATGLWSIFDLQGRWSGDLPDQEEVSVEEVAQHLEEALELEAELLARRAEDEKRFFLDEARGRFPLLFGEDDGEE